jgi:hypothetical protein
MAVNAIPLHSDDFLVELDDLLFQVCEELQLPPYRYRQAEERYRAVAAVLEATGSFFATLAPKIYPHGSMRLGTTVRPVGGPHDLDFVLELSTPYQNVNPMKLIDALFAVLKDNGVYKEMVDRKNRCVRIKYADEFYLDILPACKDHGSGGTCVQVPDRRAKFWKPSNPIGYANWFQWQAELGTRFLLEKAMPLPAQQRTEEKRPMQLIVQLLKRWRDIYYGGNDFAPISIVLTTLAATHYKGEQSVSDGLLAVLSRIAGAIAVAERQGIRLVVCNPSNTAEDLSECWDEDPDAYGMFTSGIKDFAAQWGRLLARGGDVNGELDRLFGETVQLVRVKQARRLQEARKAGMLGIDAVGRITTASAGVTPLRPNTFHGD